MAYNLPPPWDPGFCMPKNVKDEGLERRAFITKWQPRGSYDNPAVGTGGYAVPKYVLDEGYGQGTYTTKWMPSGSYAGPRVPNWLNRRPKLVSAQRLPGGGTVATIAPLSGDDEAPLPAAYESYGQRAAQALIGRVSALPQSQRAKALRAIVDKVDKSLWTRAQDIFRRFVQQGMPPAAAFPAALARAMGAGFAAEVVSTGIRGSAPQARSLLGLGCYGCAAILALGADEATDCQTSPGYSWIYGAQGVPGHWERTKAGAKDIPFCKSGPPAGASTVNIAPGDIRTHQSGPANGLKVGPFLFDGDRIPKVGFTRTGNPQLLYQSPDPGAPIEVQPIGSPVHRITEDILAWVGNYLKDLQGDEAVTYGYKDLYYKADDPDAKKWFAAMGIGPDTKIALHKLLNLRVPPQSTQSAFAKTKDPKTGKDLVIHVVLLPALVGSEARAQAGMTQLEMRVFLNPVMDPGLLSVNTIVGLASEVVTPIVNVVADGLKDLADLACDILNSAGAAAGGAAAAGAVGAPPQAGAAGVAVAQQACGRNPPPPGPGPAPARSMMPYVLLGGGALVAIALLTNKKKP